MLDLFATISSNWNIPLTNGHFLELSLRLIMDVFIVVLIIRFAYLKNQDGATYVFTFALFNVLIFFVTYLMSNASMSIGFAFGLFAVFAILRYRTKTIPIKEMTYLFLFITLGLANALRTAQVGMSEMLLVNLVIMLGTILAERIWAGHRLSEMRVRYERIDNIQPDKRDELIADLEQRTGLSIDSVKVQRIDFKRNTARIRIKYRPTK
ncbi:MAG: DUF4956 domain-containing protein [Candidatus Marinimicrobia bacterium]|nr:DUF4956 domain-containing protein [Candidatus Neomarinimicrobiota bacterium]MCF7850206.1 DUF4956 domain-containing protein [Candidatus Neomarinimicrobiota bacterium]MCF7903752.1 DUF4956 domain-containing protein [Candidatus Neomarinimicrobiota bacterium]